MRLIKPLLGLMALACLITPLEACQTLQQDYADVENVVQAKILNPFNDKTVLAVGATLGAANGIAIAYGALELCPAGQPASLGEKGPDGKFCHDKQVFHLMHADAVVAFNGYDELQALQLTHPQGAILVGGSLHDKFTSLQSAIAAVTSLTNAYVAAQVSE